MRPALCDPFDYWFIQFIQALLNQLSGRILMTVDRPFVQEGHPAAASTKSKGASPIRGVISETNRSGRSKNSQISNTSSNDSLNYK